MKLKKGFITHNVADKQVMVAVGRAAKDFNGVVQSNSTAAFVIDMLKNETDEETIVNAILEEYEVDRDTAARDVHGVIERLKGIGAIE
ncbi:MAG: PqqD family protein [Clostridia bacterium]|nr:PqqD family protein [Clostridia bacterium]